MRTATLFLLFSSISCPLGLAAFTDFSDYTQNTRFAVGEEFQSNGLSFKANNLVPKITTALVHSDPLFPELAHLHVGAGVEFLLPDNTEEVSFFYINGGGWAISINGVEPTVPITGDVEPSFLNGTSVAGVAISTEVVKQNTGGPSGVLIDVDTMTLRGPIHSFAIAGIEMSIDNVSVIVPEPSSLLLLLLGLPLLSRLRT